MPVEGAAAAWIGSEEMEQAPATPSSSANRTEQDPTNRLGIQTSLAAAPRGKGSPENTHHRYRGVRQCKSGRWASEIREPNHGKRHWLGTFNTAVDAAIAYDRAAIAYFGSRAIVNIGSRVIPCTSRTKQAQARSSATPAVRTPVVAPPGKGGLENRRHGYRGVWQRKSGRWAAEIREPNSGKRHWVGTFGTAIDAAIAYDRAAIAIIGSGAIVNFPSALPLTADAPVKCYAASCSPSAAATTVFSEHELKPMVTASVLGEHGVNQKVDAPSVFDEHEVKPMLTASVFDDEKREVNPMFTASVKPMVIASGFSEGELKPMVAASVLGEHEVEPMLAHGGSDATRIAQHWDVSWARQEEVFTDYLNDIAMYIGAHPITEKLSFQPDIKSEDYLVDGMGTEFADSPLWALGD
ncbi:dehydration-responsive element-binding protein 2D-like [Lolium rigidum]|uniref:dehydration-responsive element-binding protein 2D-like n=1 Tax=Lolium rigidum TaxID=89674 RepID=UPI001F5DA9A8|nr:dehydration-responsive element-binding protein 2D-like [Lolium rigidum]